jgi:hypothetical protein
MWEQSGFNVYWVRFIWLDISVFTLAFLNARGVILFVTPTLLRLNGISDLGISDPLHKRLTASEW